MMYYNNRSNLGSVLPDFTSLFRKLKESLPATPSETKTIGYKKIQTDPVTGALTETVYSSEGAIEDVVRYLSSVSQTPIVSDHLPVAPGYQPTEVLPSTPVVAPGVVSSDIVSSGLGSSLPILLAVAVGAYLLLSRK